MAGLLDPRALDLVAGRAVARGLASGSPPPVGGRGAGRSEPIGSPAAGRGAWPPATSVAGAGRLPSARPSSPIRPTEPDAVRPPHPRPTPERAVRRSPMTSRFWHGFADMHTGRGRGGGAPRGRGRVDRGRRAATATSMRRQRCGTATWATGGAGSGTPGRSACGGSPAYTRSGSYTTERASGWPSAWPRWPPWRCHGVLRIGRIGGGRDGGQVRPALLGRPGPARRSR